MAGPLDIFGNDRSRALGYQSGVNALLRRPQGSGIDFLAIARGSQIARDQSWQERLREQEARRMELQNVNWQDRLNQRNRNRQTSQYLSSLSANRQRAVDAGLSPAEFLQEQRQQMLADEAFRSFDPETQEQIIGELSANARVTAGNLYNTGRTREALELAQSFGLVPKATNVDVALQTGDAGRILEALNTSRGSNFALNPDNTVTVNGVDVPVNRLAQYLAATPTNTASVLTPAAEQGALTRVEQAQRDELYNRYLMASLLNNRQPKSRAEFDAFFSAGRDPLGIHEPLPVQPDEATSQLGGVPARTEVTTPTGQAMTVPTVESPTARTVARLAPVSDALRAAREDDLGFVNLVQTRPELAEQVKQELTNNLATIDSITFEQARNFTPAQSEALMAIRDKVLRNLTSLQQASERAQGRVVTEEGRQALDRLAELAGNEVALRAFANENPDQARALLNRLETARSSLVLPNTAPEKDRSFFDYFKLAPMNVPINEDAQTKLVQIDAAITTIREALAQ